MTFHFKCENNNKSIDPFGIKNTLTAIFDNKIKMKFTMRGGFGFVIPLNPVWFLNQLNSMVSQSAYCYQKNNNKKFTLLSDQTE